jgi:hypothetical protein
LGQQVLPQLPAEGIPRACPGLKVKVHNQQLELQQAQFAEQLQGILQEHKNLLAAHAAAASTNSKTCASVVTREASGNHT